MKTVSLKIEEPIFEETENILAKIKKPRNRYINEALAFYNKQQQRIMLEEKLKRESEMVGKDLLYALKDFEKIISGD